jgi:Undecaprenyl-phosphate glucose phosphotransferase
VSGIISRSEPKIIAPPGRSKSFVVLQRLGRIVLQKWMLVLVAVDVLGIAAISEVTLQFSHNNIANNFFEASAAIAGVLVVWGLVANTQFVYRRETVLAGLRTQVVRTAVSVVLAFSFILLVAFGLQLAEELSRVWLFAAAAAAFVWVVGVRLAWQGLLRSRLSAGQCLERALLLVGPNARVEEVTQTIERGTRGEVRVAAVAPIPGLRDAPTVEWVEFLVRSSAVDRVFVANFDDCAEETNAVVARLGRLAVNVTLIPDLTGLTATALRVDLIGMRPALDVNQLPLTAPQAIVKRAEDLALGSLALLMALPVFVAICVAIKLDSPGPVFFRQWRAGFHDRRFRVWKFRTMHHRMRDADALKQTSRGDPRVTRVGRVLRRTSLDELPQLFNVIWGEMSIVGPRPHALGMKAVNRPLEDVIAAYAARHRVKPGMTGWAQVNGCRGEVDSEEKLRRRVWLDCEYIASWSLAFDLWIMLRTVAVLLLKDDAY